MRSQLFVRSTLLLFVGLAFALPHSIAREWTSKDGQYRIKADAISYNETMVVLKKEDGGLLAVELAQLSDEDRRFVKSKELKDAVRKSADEMQVWTSKDGTKVRGRVLAYGKKTVEVGRRRGKVFIGDKPFAQLDPLHQTVMLRILSKLEKMPFENPRQLLEWTKSLGSNVRSYNLEGVLMELESGDEVGVPFFLFSKEDLEVLEPGWKTWLAEHSSEETREQESFLVQAQAMAYQQDRMARQQIELLKLELLATATGITNIWRVGLIPPQGRYGRPLVVMVSAPNSAAASQKALARYPGYVIGGVGKASY